MEKYEVEPCYACKQGRPYNEQNILMRQHNFPTHFYNADRIHSVYSDRLDYSDYTRAREAVESIKFNKNNYYYDWMQHSNKSWTKYFEALLQWEKIEGWRIVMFTNVSNGYELFRFDVFCSDKSIKEDRLLCNGTDNTIGGFRSRMDCEWF